MRDRSVLVMLVFLSLLGLSPLSADPTIRRGIDLFTTPPAARSHYDFAKTPIPAGFFCKGSKAFTGRVALKGLPLTTETLGQIGDADTVIERLDDAAFDAQGVARTRIQFRALSLVSVAPIKTACGAYRAYISLDGKQRVTTMSIHRTKEGGGTFVAPLAVNVRMTFIPMKFTKSKSARKLELAGTISFPGNPLPWSFRDADRMKSVTSVVLDTNGDLTPDTQLPGTSNFLPGMPPDRVITGAATWCTCETRTCHYDNFEKHCYWATGCTVYPEYCPEGFDPDPLE